MQLWQSRDHRRHRCAGLTLIELMVTLLILSILASAALPYAEITLMRAKEIELRRALRDIRSALDRFHDDWQTGKISKLDSNISDDGYPKTLAVLVEGIDAAKALGGKRKYLRRVPRDPFDESQSNAQDHWVLRGYQDDFDSQVWGGKDVYDVRSKSERTALDNSHYKDW